MADVRQLPNKAEIEEQAAAWIARLQADDVSAQDHAQFQTWLEAHPLHARTYEEMGATWTRFARAAPLVQAVAFGESMRSTFTARRRKVAGRKVSRSAGWAVAASLLVAGLIGAFWFEAPERSASEFRTAVGQRSTVTLDDGSTLELNSDGYARVEYSRDVRVIRLERGEAFFTVAHDTARPFWVATGDSRVRAVGTAFNVDLHQRGMSVTVSEGTVEVAAAKLDDDVLRRGDRQPVSRVSAGQQADVAGSVVSVRHLSEKEVAHATSWRQGLLLFDDRPLDEIIQELSRYTTLKLVMHDDTLRRLPVGGAFKAGSQGAEALLTLLETGFGLCVSRQQDRVYIDAPVTTSLGAPSTAPRCPSPAASAVVGP